jgi:hypothetical protein
MISSTDIFCLYVVLMGLALQVWYIWVSVDSNYRRHCILKKRHTHGL